jgi:hypothetical protein
MRRDFWVELVSFLNSHLEDVKQYLIKNMKSSGFAVRILFLSLAVCPDSFESLQNPVDCGARDTVIPVNRVPSVSRRI